MTKTLSFLFAFSLFAPLAMLVLMQAAHV